MGVHPFSTLASLTVAFRTSRCRKVRQNYLCLCLQQSVNLSIYRMVMAMFLEVCTEVIPHVYRHDLMEVNFGAASQGDQISQVDFSRNPSVYFYALLYLNTEGLTGMIVCIMLEGVIFLITLKRLISIWYKKIKCLYKDCMVSSCHLST